MSYAVLHMDKFKKNDVARIQGHNQRERECFSNPDIDYERTKLNYDLHNEQPVSFLDKAQNRIDELQLTKKPRHDAVYMCGIIVSSDQEFFKNMNEHQTKKFFWDSYDFLAKFVGKENIVSAVVHMDEKTPHMHFMHVPVNKKNKLCARDIYTRASLQKLQTDFVIYMQNHGHWVKRGVKKGQGSAKKHLDTPEFKQQMEALNLVRQEIADKTAELDNLRSEAESIANEKDAAIAKHAQVKKELEVYAKIAFEARAAGTYKAKLTKPGLTNARKIYDEAQEIISAQKKFVVAQELIMHENDDLKKENKKLVDSHHKISGDMAAQAQTHAADMRNLNTKLQAAVSMQDYYRNIVSDFKIRNDFLRQSHILPQFRSYEAAQKRAKPVEQKVEQAAEVVAPKTQVRQQPKRSNDFEM